MYDCLLRLSLWWTFDKASDDPTEITEDVAESCSMCKHRQQAWAVRCHRERWCCKSMQPECALLHETGRIYAVLQGRLEDRRVGIPMHLAIRPGN